MTKRGSGPPAPSPGGWPESAGCSSPGLAEATVRSVTRGILGVALIQSILAGLGFLAVGVPAAGLWALLCLLLSVVQIGIFPVTIPILIYVFSQVDPVTFVLFLIWSLFVGALDNILKPILLGRGVAVPMAVIFVGAIGGFLTSGIIGLFVGSVVLVLGYKLLLAWLYGEEADAGGAAGPRRAWGRVAANPVPALSPGIEPEVPERRAPPGPRRSHFPAGSGRRRCCPAGLAGDDEPGVVPVEDVLDDGEPEPGPAGVAGAGLVHPVEALGEPREVLRRRCPRRRPAPRRMGPSAPAPGDPDRLPAGVCLTAL